MTKNSSEHVVIVGAGHAGGTMAATLREKGHKGPITVIGSEPFLPYQRPPLSKDYLKESVTTESLLLKNADYYDEQDITVKTACTATAIHRQELSVELSSGEVIGYDYLVLATGSAPRQLRVPGNHLDGVMPLRNVNDAGKLKHSLALAKNMLIIGGGYIGLEVAASARARGVNVVVVERESRLLARVASAPLSEFFERFHQSQGVEIIHETEVSEFAGKAGQITEAILSDGRKVSCDLALVGVGATPCDQIARNAGLHCENGIVVDNHARTEDARIFAIGDVSYRPLPTYDNRMFRLESVPNAIEQARIVAATILGESLPDPELPWFWSNQYDLKLQIAGLPFDSDGLIERRYSDTKLAIFHLNNNQVVAVESLNSPLDFIAAKKLILEKTPVATDKLTDVCLKAKDCAL